MKYVPTMMAGLFFSLGFRHFAAAGDNSIAAWIMGTILGLLTGCYVSFAVMKDLEKKESE